MKACASQSVKRPFAWIWLVFALSLSMVASPRTHGVTLALTPSADADIEQFSPDSNFGSAGSAVSGSLGTSASHEIRRALFKFDVAGSIPAGAVINSATLQVQVVKIPATPVDSTFDLRRVLQDWSETGVTWNSRLSPGASWATPGAIGSADSTPTASSSVFVSGLGTNLFPSTGSLVADVQAWVDNPGTNFGWLLISEDEASLRTARHFGTRESGASAPVLTIDFTPPPLALSFLTPTNGETFPAHSDVQVAVTAQASVSNATISQVEFRLGTNLVGIVTNPPFSVTISNISTGNYQLSAQAIDSLGASNTAIVFISVFEVAAITIDSPTNGQVFPLGTNILVQVTVPATGTAVSSVTLFENNLLLAQFGAPPYTFDWTPVLAGTYILTASTTDVAGQSATSAPVVIHVQLGRPKIRITRGPPNFARLRSPSIVLSGTATGEVEIDRVEVQLNNGGFQRASGTNSWSAQITLAAGTNAVRVQGVDLADTTNSPIVRFYTYVVHLPLVVQIQGQGTVTPDWNGKPREIGKTYRLKARPGFGWIFADWSQALSSIVQSNRPAVLSNAGPLLQFVMQSNLVLTANFVPNPFPAVQGNYTGLIINTNTPAPEVTGSFTLQVGGFGAFTGSLILNGTRSSFQNQFNAAGHAQFAVLRPSLRPVAVTLELDLTNGTDTIQGSVTDGSPTNLLSGNRVVFIAQSNPAPQAGVHLFSLQRLDRASEPEAAVAATISAAGGAAFRGRLRDGRSFSLATALAKDGSAPFYLPLSRGTEIVAGWFRFGEDSSTPVAGTVNWMMSGTNGFAVPLCAIPQP